MSASDFADLFRAHAIPKLRSECAVWGARIAAGQSDWVEAEASVWASAARYGAAYLPDDRDAELRDWIGAQILQHLIQSERTAEQLEKEEASNPVGYYRRMVEAANDKDAVHWIACALSPEYRAHARAVARAR